MLTNTLITILATVVVLGVLIFVHELGHFITAKAVDIEVPRFSIGFGPRILGFRRGETEYVISLLPLGGYVKMAGTEDMEVIEGAGTINDTGVDIPPTERKIGPRDFDAKSLPARALVISAGVIMNLLFAFFAFSFVSAVWGVPGDPGTTLAGVTEERLTAGSMALSNIKPGMKVTAINNKAVTTRRDLELAIATGRAGDAEMRFATGESLPFQIPKDDSLKQKLTAALEPFAASPALIEQVVKDDVADKAGLKPNDRVVQAAGRPIDDWSELVDQIEHSAGKPLQLVVERDGQQVPITVTPRDDSRDGIHYGRIGIGRTTIQEKLEKVSFAGAIKEGAHETWETVALTVDFLVGMATGRQSPRSMGGPIMIGQLSGQVARLGLQPFLHFMALLSVNLAVLNMLPIPVLDGGHLVFLFVEGIRGGRPLSMAARMRWTQVGFVMIVCIMVWAIGNDLWRVIFQ